MASFSKHAMTENLLAYCGLDCADCYAFKSYATGSEELRIEAAQKWNSPDYSVVPSDINCLGCKSEEGPHFKWCADCPMRACGIGRGVETCAHCDDFICDKVKQSGEHNIKRLEAIRAELV